MHDEPPTVEALEIGGPPPGSATRRLVRFGATGVAVVLLLGLGAHAYVSDRLPRQTVVAGVDVGGLTRGDAEQRLRTELAPRSEAVLPVTIGAARADLWPSSTGLSVDYAASITRARPGSGWALTETLRVLTGGSDSAAVVVVDHPALRRSVTILARTRDSDPTEPQIVAEGVVLRVVAGRDGVRLRQRTAAAQVAAGYLTTTDPVTLAHDTRPPVTRAEATAAFLEDSARPALSAAARVDLTGYGSFTVTRTQLARVIAFVNVGGAYHLVIDADRLRAEIRPQLIRLKVPGARDGEVTYFDGRCIVRTALVGEHVDSDALARALTSAVRTTGTSRRARATLVDATPPIPDAETQNRCR